MSIGRRGTTGAHLLGPPLLLGLPLLLGCATGGTERTENPDTGSETVRMKGNWIETPGPYGLAFNLAVVGRRAESGEGAYERGYAVFLTYRGDQPIRVPYASTIELRLGDGTWELRGVVQRRISGVVGCTMGVPCSYVTHIMAPLDGGLVERVVEAEGFTVVIDTPRGRLRGTADGKAVRRIREFLREIDPARSRPAGPQGAVVKNGTNPALP